MCPLRSADQTPPTHLPKLPPPLVASARIQSTPPHPPVSKISTGRPPSDRVTSAIITTSAGLLAITSFYIQPQTAEGLSDLALHLDCLRSQTALLLILGDSNGHSHLWGPAAPNSVGHKLEDLIHAHGLTVLNCPDSSPTYTSHNGSAKSWIDISLASSSLAPSLASWSVLPDLIPPSDHSAIQTTLNLIPSTTHRLKRDWKNVDWMAFSQTMTSTLPAKPRLTDLPATPQIDAHLLALQHSFCTAIDQHVPYKRICQYSKPWFTEEVKAAYRQMKLATAYSKQVNTPQAFSQYKKAKATFQQTARQAKKQCFQDFSSNLNGANMWSSFKKLSKPTKPTPLLPSLLQTTGWVDNPRDKLQLLASFLFPSDPNPPSPPPTDSNLSDSQLEKPLHRSSPYNTA